MDEASWLASTDPGAMLDHLLRRNPESGTIAGERMGFRTSDRKLRLFACACRERSRHPLHAPCQGDYGPEGERIDDPAGTAAAWARPNLSDGDLTRPLKASLLRDIVGNPFRPSELRRVKGHLCQLVTRQETPQKPPRRVVSSTLVREAWRHVPWLTPAALGIARRAYDLRDWEALPILADALQDAGCEDAEILHHLRDLVLCPGCSRNEITEWYGGGGGWCVYCGRSGPELHWIPAARLLPSHAHLHGPHVRGCHVLDLVLGKG